MLQQLGFEDVDGSRGGSAALEMMRAKRYGLVISDWNMEPMTGYDLFATGARRSRTGPNTDSSW